LAKSKTKVNWSAHIDSIFPDACIGSITHFFS
jgi:hypothetical protein